MHDGDYDAGGNHRGETFKTTTKDNAGGNANWNEKFVLNKPGNLHVSECRCPLEFFTILRYTILILSNFPETMDVLRFQLFDSDTLNDDFIGS